MNIIDAWAEKCRQSSSCSSGENFSAPFEHKAWPHEKLCEKLRIKTSRVFKYLRNKFPNVSDTNIK